MNKTISLLILMLMSNSSLAADAVSRLENLAAESRSFKEDSVNCLVDARLKGLKGWASSDCDIYRKLSKPELQNFRSTVKSVSTEFKAKTKSGDFKDAKTKKGLRSLLLIQSNMLELGRLSKEIKALLMKKPIR